MSALHKQAPKVFGAEENAKKYGSFCGFDSVS
jgi:hypothetical protein